MNVWSSGMILTSGARGREFDSCKRKKLFSIFYMYVCMYVCMYLLLKSNIFRYGMSVWSNGMIFSSSVRGREFDSRKRKKLFSIFYMYVCIYY